MLGTWHSAPPAIGGAPAAAAALRRLDLTDAEAVERTVTAFRPDAVAHLAAVSRVADAARDAERAREVNVAGTRRLLGAAAALGARVLLLSTDSVFDGTAGPYGEDALPAPVNAYGGTKAAAEALVREAGAHHLVVRTSLVHGWPGPGQHGNFATETLGRLRRGETVRAYTDMLRTPVHAGALADMLAEALERGIGGVCHLAGRESVTMHAFALAIAGVFGLDPRPVVAEPAPRDAGDEARPRALGLVCARAAGELGLALPSVREGLVRMRDEGAAALS